MGGNQSSKSEEGGKPGRSEEGPDPQRRRSRAGMVGGGERWGRPASCRSPKHVQAEKQDRAGQGSGLGRDWGWLQRKEAGGGQLALGGHHVDIVVRAHEPLILVQVVVVHVLDHHEGLFLGRVGSRPPQAAR